jgi:MOSC domain-containing protein YiiM
MEGRLRRGKSAAEGGDVARIDSVNVGKEWSIGTGLGRTGINKVPQSAPVPVTEAGLAGDYIGDTCRHGGPDQAVYLYFAGDYAFWAERLGRSLAPGTFGENLTISGPASADMAVGDRLLVGAVVLEVTAPRIPCATLAQRMNDPSFVTSFSEAARPGAYCRVLAGGVLAAGTAVEHRPYAGPRIGVVALFHDNYVAKSLDLTRIDELLAAPIAMRQREKWEAHRAAHTRAGATA